MTTPTPEAMSPAQEAWFDYRKDYGSWHRQELSHRHSAFVAGYEIAMTDKLTAIAAQAKAEALREAADEFGSWGPTGIAAANALRNRAATIEGKNE